MRVLRVLRPGTYCNIEEKRREEKRREEKRREEKRREACLTLEIKALHNLTVGKYLVTEMA
jgi:hypothetical protein